ncbi:RuvC-like resolvase [Gordonia phage KappaFarmDelta]|nr:RuvC-like resolvase [Gordonia phage KappaFarmDelta]
MSIVGLDPSLTSTGIAILARYEGDDVAHVRTLRSVGHQSTDSKSWVHRSRRIVTQTRFVVQAIPRDTELVVIEEMPAHMKMQHSLIDRWVLWFGIVSQLDQMRIPVAVVNPATREKWATGKVVRGLDPKDRKARVTTAVRAQWDGHLEQRVRNHDEADALTLASMGALHTGWTLPFDVGTWQHNGLTSVTWPKENS